MTVQNHLFWVVCFLAVSGCVHAYTLDHVAIEDVLAEDLSVRETIVLQVSNNTVAYLSLQLPQNAYDIVVNGVPSQGVDSVNLTLDCVSCTRSLAYSVKHSVRSLSGDMYSYQRTLSLPISPLRLEYKVSLPPGYLISGQTNTSESSIVPSSAAIESDGRAIVVHWRETQPEMPKIYAIRYEGHESQESVLQEMKNELSERYVWLFLVIVGTAGLSVGLLLRRKFVPIATVPSSLLNSDEKAIIRLLQGKNGQKQKDIARALNWSKSKTSSVCTNLVQKSIITREKMGRNYTVTLSAAVERL